MKSSAQLYADFKRVRADLKSAFAGLTAFLDELESQLNTNPGPAPATKDYKCPACGAPMRSRNGYNGPFFGCSNYPDCRSTRDADGTPRVRSASRSSIPAPDVNGDTDDFDPDFPG